MPFIFIAEPNKFWMGVSNGTHGMAACLVTNNLSLAAIAGGMMLAASYSLVYEGSTFSDHSSKFIYEYSRSINDCNSGGAHRISSPP